MHETDIPHLKLFSSLKCDFMISDFPSVGMCTAYNERRESVLKKAERGEVEVVCE